MDILAEYYHWPDPITATVVAITAAAKTFGAAAAAGMAVGTTTLTGGGIAGAAGLATGQAIGAAGAFLGSTAGMLTVGGLGVAALGQIQAGQAAAAQAKGQEAMAQYNARVQQQEAEMAAQQSLYRQSLHNREMSRAQGALLANLAASGVSASEGTPLLIQQTQATEAEMDRLMIAYQGQISSGRSMSQASLDRLQGSIYGQRAKNEATTGYLKAGTSLLTGFGQYFADKE